MIVDTYYGDVIGANRITIRVYLIIKITCKTIYIKRSLTPSTHAKYFRTAMNNINFTFSRSIKLFCAFGCLPQCQSKRLHKFMI